MILLYHPRSTKPRNRRLPLSILSIAAVLENREEYVVVDGNLEPSPTPVALSIAAAGGVEMMAVSVMPGPQMAAAIDTCREMRQRYPAIPIVWGGYFPSIYTAAALNAPYVDFAVRGQGEDTILELLDALRGLRGLDSVRGLSYRGADGSVRNNPERPMRGPDSFPWLPYHRVPVEQYLRPSFFGRRTAVHQASVGCPFKCGFCGVITAFGSRQKMESPARTEAVLTHLVRTYRADSVQFYDNNFFLEEDHARELMDRIAPLRLRWWCEARVDTMLRFSDATFEAVRRAGGAMIFFGAESGSDWALEEMNKQLTTAQTLELAARIRRFGIIPEFSFVVGNPADPRRDTDETIRFIRRIKRINPESEIIIYPYTPVPQRRRMYGNVDGQIEFPGTPDEWATPEWQDFAVRRNPKSPWLRRPTRQRIDDFRTVVACRWPTVQDLRLPGWARRSLRMLSAWRYLLRFYAWPYELRLLQRLIDLHRPEIESL